MMKPVANYYSLNFHVMPGQVPPIAGAQLETLPFGVPPFELRPIWTFQANELSVLAELIRNRGITINFGESPYWSGPTVDNAGSRLFGVAVLDDPDAKIDPGDGPIGIARRSD